MAYYDENSGKKEQEEKKNDVIGESVNNSQPEQVDHGDLMLAYENYRITRDKKDLNKVVNLLRPTINYALIQNKGAGNPYVETYAKLMAANSVKAYDPGYNVSLPTYVTSNLRKLTRVAREANQPIKIPERYIYELASINKAEAELTERLGREPDLSEIADEVGIPASKIGKIRDRFIKQVGETSYYSGSGLGGEDESSTPSSVDESASDKSEFLQEAMEYVFSDLGHNDKKIMEYLTGFGGKERVIKDPKEIAKKLKISESTVSRSANKIMSRISEYESYLNDIYGGTKI